MRITLSPLQVRAAAVLSFYDFALSLGRTFFAVNFLISPSIDGKSGVKSLRLHLLEIMLNCKLAAFHRLPAALSMNSYYKDDDVDHRSLFARMIGT